MARITQILSVAAAFLCLMAGERAAASENLTVSPLPAPLDFGSIVLASGSSASIAVSPTTGVVSVVSGSAVLLPAAKTISPMPTVTVKCEDTGGNGCKNATHTIAISPGANVLGRAVAISALNITTPTLTSGGNINIGTVAGNGTNSVSFNIVSPSNGAQSWTVTFKVGMTFTISGAASPFQTQWKYVVANN